MNHLNGNHARLTHPITSDQGLAQNESNHFHGIFLRAHTASSGEGAVIERLRRSGLELDPLSGQFGLYL